MLNQELSRKIHAALQSNREESTPIPPMGVLLTSEEREAIEAIAHDLKTPGSGYKPALAHVLRRAVRFYLEAYRATR